MIIVPVSRDKITTKDGDDFRVYSYTNLKAEPAVYIVAEEGQNDVVYFRDIAEINGVKVEYSSSNKVFTALGVVKRKHNLPQPKDIITIKTTSLDRDNSREVVSLKLHNKNAGITKGLVICDDNVCHELTNITDVDSSTGGEKFNQKGFISYYADYLPMKYKKV